MRTLVLTALTVVSSAVGVAPAGSLFGAFRRLGTNPLVCDLAHVFLNGTNETYATNVCDGIQQTYPAFSSFDPVTNSLLLAVSTATYIFGVNVETHTLSKLAPLPQPYNESDPYIGLVTVAGASYLVTQYHLYQISGGSLVEVAFYADGFPALEPQVAAAPGGGSGTSGRIFVSDGTSRNIQVVDLGNPTNVSTIRSSSVSSPWDLQYSAEADELVELVNYHLYATNSRTGRSRSICPIPDGPGYPRVNGISQDGRTFFFMDFSNEYTIDIATGQILSKAPIFSAPLVIGFPVWLS